MQALRKQMRKNPLLFWLAAAGLAAVVAAVVVVISGQGGPPAVVGNYTIRPLGEWSEGELRDALADAETLLIPPPQAAQRWRLRAGLSERADHRRGF